jgi:hypothetical protein
MRVFVVIIFLKGNPYKLTGTDDDNLALEVSYLMKYYTKEYVAIHIDKVKK